MQSQTREGKSDITSSTSCWLTVYISAMKRSLNARTVSATKQSVYMSNRQRDHPRQRQYNLCIREIYLSATAAQPRQRYNRVYRAMKLPTTAVV